MKKYLLPLYFLVVTAMSLVAQVTSKGINYQCIIRDNSGMPLANQTGTMTFTLLSSNGDVEYTESQVVTTNDFGLINLIIGQNGVGFDQINWVSADPNAPKLSRTEFNGVLLGTSPLMSVPYALYAHSAKIKVETDTTLVGEGTLSSPLKMAQQGAVTGQVLRWNGTSWTPQDATGVNGFYMPGNGIQIAGNVIHNIGDTNPADDLTSFSQASGELSGVFSNLTLLPGVVTQPKLADGAVGPAKLQDNAVTEQKLGDGSVGPAKLKDTCVTEQKLRDGAVGPAKLKDNSVTEQKLGDGSVGSAKLKDSSVTEQKLGNGSVGPAKLKDTCVTEQKLRDGAVGPAKLKDNSVTEQKLGDGSVGPAKLKDNAVTEQKLSDGSVGPAKLKDNAVTKPKLADNAVGQAELEDNAVTQSKIANAAVTAAKLNQMGATSTQVLKWNGTNWAPAADATGPTYSAGNGIQIASNTISNTGDLSTSNEIQTLSLVGQNLSLNLGGGSVDLSNVGTSHWTASGNDIYNNNSGNVAINTTNPGLFALKMKNNSSFGFDLEASDNSNNWEFFVTSGSSGNLELYYNGGYKGFFNSTTGNYVPTSDRRLKKDIMPVGSVLNSIAQLRPVTYKFIASNPEGKNTVGFIAQEVEPLFPELVEKNVLRTGEEVYSLNYTGFSVVTVKAIQEQQTQIEGLKKENAELKSELQQLQADVAALKTMVKNMGKH